MTRRGLAGIAAAWVLFLMLGRANGQDFNFQRLGEFGGTVNAVAVSGTTAYVGRGESLWVFNISNPRRPAAIATLPLGASTTKIALIGSTAFVSCGPGGVKIVNVGNPHFPALITTYATASDALAVAAFGNLIYIAEGDAGFEIVDMTDPANPVSKSKVATTGYVRDIDASHPVAGADVAVYAASSDGLQVWNASNPLLPTLLGTPTVGAEVVTAAPSPTRYVFAAYSEVIKVVDVSDAAHPTEIGSGTIYRGAVTGMAALVTDPGSAQEHVYALVGTSYTTTDVLAIFDPAGGSEPPLVGAANLPAGSRQIAVSGRNAFVADSTGGMRVIDTTLLGVPNEIGSVATLTIAVDVAVQNDTAFTTNLTGYDYANGLVAINVANPTHPAASSSVSLPVSPGPVAVAGDFAAVGTSQNFHTIQIADPAQMVVYFRGPATEPTAIGIEGQLIYVLNYDTPLWIYNAGFAGLNAIWSYAGFAGRNSDMAVRNSLIYVAGSDQTDGGAAGLKIADASNLEAPPVERSTLNTHALGLHLALMGNLAIYSDDAGVIHAADVSNPSAPHIVSDYQGAAGPTDLFAEYGIVFALLPNNLGVEAINYADPAHPALAGMISNAFSEAPQAISGRGNLICVADGGAGLVTLRYQGPFPQPTPLPNPTDSPSFQAVKAVILGEANATISEDLNNDGVVDVADLVIAIQTT